MENKCVNFEIELEKIRLDLEKAKRDILELQIGYQETKVNLGISRAVALLLSALNIIQLKG